jgi:hypothetical protein
MSWTERALCVGADLEIFYPKKDNYDEARRICLQCVVRTECAAAVMARESGETLSMRFGFQGGMTPKERYQLDPKSRRGNKFSLPAEAQALRCRLYREGESDAVIADRIGRTEQQVRAWRLREKLPANSIGDDEHKRRLELHHQGLTDSAIAQQLGTTRDIIRSWRISTGLAPNDKRGAAVRPPRDDDPITILWGQGLTDREIAERVDRSPDTVRKWRAHYGLKRNEPA